MQFSYGVNEKEAVHSIEMHNKKHRISPFTDLFSEYGLFCIHLIVSLSWNSSTAELLSVKSEGKDYS